MGGDLKRWGANGEPRLLNGYGLRAGAGENGSKRLSRIRRGGDTIASSQRTNWDPFRHNIRICVAPGFEKASSGRCPLALAMFYPTSSPQPKNLIRPSTGWLSGRFRNFLAGAAVAMEPIPPDFRKASNSPLGNGSTHAEVQANYCHRRTTIDATLGQKSKHPLRAAPNGRVFEILLG